MKIENQYRGLLRTQQFTDKLGNFYLLSFALSWHRHELHVIHLDWGSKQAKKLHLILWPPWKSLKLGNEYKNCAANFTETEWKISQKKEENACFQKSQGRKETSAYITKNVCYDIMQNLVILREQLTLFLTFLDHW